MLKTLRKNRGFTQAELAKRSGISQSYISDLEKDYFVYSPTVRQIIALSNALDADIVELFMYFAKKEMEYNVNRC